jgi:hypothetical protein
MAAEADRFIEHMRAYACEELTIKVLEGELRKRKARHAVLAAQFDKTKSRLASVLTDAERQTLSEQIIPILHEVANQLRTEASQKLGIGENLWALECDEPPDLLFDESGYEYPSVCVVYPQAKTVVINVRESLIKDPKSIGNPFIVAAIDRYVDRLAVPGTRELRRRRDMREKLKDSQTESLDTLTRKDAHSRLKRIFDALTAGANVRARKEAQQLNQSILSLSLSDQSLDEAHFSKLAGLLNTESVRRFERSNLPTNLKSKLQRELPAIFGDDDRCKRVLEFLTKTELPKKRTGPSLRNSFFAYERQIKGASFRRYKAEELSSFRELTRGLPEGVEISLDEKEIEKIVIKALDRNLLHRGIGKLDTYENVRTSNLVWEEIPLSRQEVS